MFAVKFPVSTMKKSFFATASLLAIVLMLVLTACGGGTQAASSTTSSGSNAQQYDLAIRPGSGLTVSLFASGTSAYFAPDAVVVDGSHVFIGYQNVTAKDCTDTNSSTVVEYKLDGSVVKTFSVPGHNDGLRVDPSTHLLWATSCEDGNPKSLIQRAGPSRPTRFPRLRMVVAMTTSISSTARRLSSHQTPRWTRVAVMSILRWTRSH